MPAIGNQLSATMRYRGELIGSEFACTDCSTPTHFRVLQCPLEVNQQTRAGLCPPASKRTLVPAPKTRADARKSVQTPRTLLGNPNTPIGS